MVPDANLFFPKTMVKLNRNYDRLINIKIIGITFKTKWYSVLANTSRPWSTNFTVCLKFIS